MKSEGNEGAAGPGISGEDPAAWIAGTIREFCRTSPENSLRNKENDRAYGDPLVGFSSGADPLYAYLRSDIGNPLMTPEEIFRQAFPGTDARAGDLTVISWVLPHNPVTIADNARQRYFPSGRWVFAKRYGSGLSKALSRHIIGLLAAAGHEAVAPQYTPFWHVGRSQKYGLASTWSERHAAHVSGLGTFGLCDGLITPVGKAMLCGSVIARIAIPPTPRPPGDYHSSCLYYAKGSCKKCVGRCPAGAISENGHDKLRCFLYCMVVTRLYAIGRYGLNEYGCGMCQTGVPCDVRNPVPPLS